jgi:hypothetical protein
MRTTIDTARLGAGVSRPGIDPRLWFSLAIVTDVAVDPESGVYADLQLVPSGDKECARVPTSYGGPGYGAWMPLNVDDLVAVALPRGDSAGGPVVVARLWSGSDPPPVELGAANGADPPSSPVIVVGPGQTVRVICRAGATVEVVSDALGASADPVTLSTPNDSNWSRLAQALAAWVPVPLDGGAALRTILTSFLGLAAAPPTPPDPPSPPIAPWPAPTAAERLKAE